jgi:hypothetical protein
MFYCVNTDAKPGLAPRTCATDVISKQNCLCINWRVGSGMYSYIDSSFYERDIILESRSFNKN